MSLLDHDETKGNAPFPLRGRPELAIRHRMIHTLTCLPGGMSSAEDEPARDHPTTYGFHHSSPIHVDAA